jgi:hypothetical protein
MLSTNGARGAHLEDLAARFEELVGRGDTAGIVRLLQEVVPSYHPSDSVVALAAGAAGDSHPGAHGLAVSAA